MSNIAIIPARGNSKRIPRKNIKDFLGKPIIAYSIQTALDSGLFDDVIVSTDDHEIAEIARSYGASVPFLRSQENSGDHSTTLDVVKEVCVELGKQSYVFDYVCCIYPTAPFISCEVLIKGYEMLVDSGLNSVFPLVAYSYPIWRGFEVDGDNWAKLVWPEYLNCRSQDLRKVYHDAGQWYWLNPIKINSSIFTDNSKGLILEETEVQDIDTFTDWKLAEMKYTLARGL